MQVVVGLSLFIALSGGFMLMYVLNKRTPLPEGCSADDMPQCDNCAKEGTGCKFRM